MDGEEESLRKRVPPTFMCGWRMQKHGNVGKEKSRFKRTRREKKGFLRTDSSQGGKVFGLTMASG